MWPVAELQGNVNLKAQIQRLFAVFFILMATSAYATDRVLQSPEFATAKIRLTSIYSSKIIDFIVKLAVTPSQHSYGLMFSAPLSTKSGMLFVFKDTKPRAFWMKNTPIPLDMLFFDDTGLLVAVIANARPNTMTLRRSQVAAKFVLEIGGGEAARLNIQIGSRLHLPIPLAGHVSHSSRKKLIDIQTR